MRKQLQKLGDANRYRFTAEVVRFGWKRGFKKDLQTILVKDVYLDGATPKLVSSHLWFTVGKQFERLALKSGDKIQFSARVKEYLKGYKGRRWDVLDKPIERDSCLSFPTQIQKVQRNAPTTQMQLGI